jgi:hypothetical protein
MLEAIGRKVVENLMRRLRDWDVNGNVQSPELTALLDECWMVLSAIDRAEHGETSEAERQAIDALRRET